MYYEHFGLTQAPFKITPNTDFFFSGGNRGPVLEALIYAITRGEGIVKVTGEVGSGKTMLCNMLQNRLPDNVDSVYLANPSVAPEDVLHAIAFELQLGMDRKADRLEVMHTLQDYLVMRHGEGKRVVVFIEESQSMPLATLEEIRLLSNLETRNDKLLQIVLFGQPELDETLRRPDIRQLRDRIAHSFRLQPLTDEEVREYLTFRMRAAGYRGPEIFPPAVVKQIAKASSGLTRRVNLIADKALLAAFSENTHSIKPRHVQAALRDSEFGQAPAWRPSPAFGWYALAMLVGIGLGAAFYAFFEGQRSRAPAVVAGAAPVPAPVAPAPVPATPAAVPVAVAPPAVQPTVASPSAQTASESENSADIIESRMAVTDRWVGSGLTTAYSIQLFVAYHDEQLRNHLNALPKFIEMNDIYMYRSAAQGRPMVNVLWGSFANRDAALEELAHLTPSLRAKRPYVRTMSGIRAEIERQRGSARK